MMRTSFMVVKLAPSLKGGSVSPQRKNQALAYSARPGSTHSHCNRDLASICCRHRSATPSPVRTRSKVSVACVRQWLVASARKAGGQVLQSHIELRLGVWRDRCGLNWPAGSTTSLRALIGGPELDEHDRPQCLGVFGEVCGRLYWRCHGHREMTTRYQVVVATPEASVCKGMRERTGIYELPRGQVFGSRIPEALAARSAASPLAS
jgi:hypothetical protein